MKTLDTKELELTFQEYVASTMVSYEIPDVELHIEKNIKTMCYLISLCHKVPAKILQEKKEICRYPANNWEWVKQFIPFMRPKYKIHYLTEHVTFPTLKLPENLNPCLYVKEAMYTGNWDHLDE